MTTIKAALSILPLPLTLHINTSCGKDEEFIMLANSKSIQLYFAFSGKSTGTAFMLAALASVI